MAEMPLYVLDFGKRCVYLIGIGLVVARVVSSALVAGQEVLYQISNKNDGVLTLEYIDDLSVGQV
jgi:hypothetical protein